MATVRERSLDSFDGQLQELKDNLLAMGGRCEQLISDALRAVEEGDPELARAVEDADRQINADELALDAMAVRMLALRQPVGRDLRLLVTSLKVVVDLERIADEAVNIAERAELLSPHLPEIAEAKALLPEMGARAAEMLRVALDALVAENAEAAQQVRAMDDAVDNHHQRILGIARAFMTRHPEHAPIGLGLAAASKYVERIADLCTNIAEMVVYMVRGVDVRHRKLRRQRN